MFDVALIDNFQCHGKSVDTENSYWRDKRKNV
jgi:hypothetical protein